MGVNERLEYLYMMQRRFRRAKGETRGELLHKMLRQQRGKTRGHEVDKPLRVICEMVDRVCTEHATLHLVAAAGAPAAHDALRLTLGVLGRLQRVSMSPVQPRQVRAIGARCSATVPGSQKSSSGDAQHPPLAHSWDEQKPRHSDVDCVHHRSPNVSVYCVHIR